jgi:hypothetical protein
MFKLRLAILGAAAALALGTASALAMSESAGSGDRDAHGDAVASAARNCPHGASGVHGACVSAIASANGQAHRDGQEGAEHANAHSKNHKPPQASERGGTADTAELAATSMIW